MIIIMFISVIKVMLVEDVILIKILLVFKGKIKL